MKQVSDQLPITGMVGIFWLTRNLKDFFHVSAQKVTEGQLYGDWIISKDDHATLWEWLYKSGELNTIPRIHREDYAILPRGRVSFNRNTYTYIVYCGEWITDSIKTAVINRFDLSVSATIFEIDGHYEYL